MSQHVINSRYGVDSLAKHAKGTVVGTRASIKPTNTTEGEDSDLRDFRFYLHIFVTSSPGYIINPYSVFVWCYYAVDS